MYMTKIQQYLAQLDLTENNNLLDTRAATNATSDPSLRIIIEQASSYKADFVYVRYFADGRPAIPQIYIFDNTEHAWERDKFAQYHKRIWNAGIVPLLYVFTSTTLDIFSCARKADFLSREGKVEYNPATSIKWIAFAEKDRKRLSAKNIDNGVFWENTENSKYLNKDQSARNSLIIAIRELDNQIEKKKILPPLLGRKLLILCILVKYLEDRKVFPPNFFGKFIENAISFFQILKNRNATIRFFDEMKEHFRGDVFLLSEEEKANIDPDSLDAFSILIEGKTLHDQMYFWELYSFEDIPVQLISYIYQIFVVTPGAIYTPHILVELLVNEVMPASKLPEQYRVIDPACGSGVFLVQAFKQHIIAWRFRNNWERPNIDELKAILKNNIFGVDVDPTAAELTVFSLNLAICDALQPDVIWNELKFDTLKNENVFIDDFFALDFSKKGDFDLVIGNPPFVSELSPAADKINALYRDRFHRVLPDNNISYLFCEHSIEALAGNKGKVCLILPHGILYNVNTQEYRYNLFSRYRLREVLDFISIRGLFSADVKVCALFFEKIPFSDADCISHVIFRRSNSTAEQLCFEIDHYDVCPVSCHDAQNIRYVWRANLFGGARAKAILDKITNAVSFSAFLKKMGAAYGQGFNCTEKDSKKTAKHITGKPFLPTDAFISDDIDPHAIEICQEHFFATPQPEIRYKAPMLLLKEHTDLPVAIWDKSDLVFRHSILSVTGLPINCLQGIHQRLRDNKKDYRLFLALLSSRSITSKATSVLKDDIDNLPYPDDYNEIRLSESESILRDDIIEYMFDYIRLGQKSKLASQSATDDDLKKFAEIYCECLSAAFSDLRPYKYFELDNLLCYPFYFGERPNISLENSMELKQNLLDLCFSRVGKSLQILRVIRLYQGNVIFLIKPRNLRYWLQSIAIRDADETFAELIMEDSI